MKRFLLPIAVFVPLVAAAQGPGADAPSTSHANAPAIAARRLAGTIRIDGRVDDAAWQGAAPVTTFTQVVPTEGAPVSERTEIRILFDDEALYIGARLYDRGRVTTRLGRRDMSMEASDWLTVILDTYHDHSTAAGFEINPSGVRRDQTRSRTSEDDSWEPVWEGSATIDAEGWSAEMRIPFSQLRFNAAPLQTWGIQVERQIARSNEFAVFSFTPTTQPGGIPRFGHLEGLAELRPGKRLEVLPYTVMRADAVNREGNPYRDDREQTVSAGADFKYRVTSDLTLDLTVNPDFGQVEVDPAQVNLSAIETRYQEKRPFFVEGSELFRFGSGGAGEAFYSRRIGRPPQVLPRTPWYDAEDAVRILGAAKLTGRTRTGWSVGVMEAVTRREDVTYRLSPTGPDQRGIAEPFTNYFVARLRRDFRAGQSAVGSMFTAVNRDLADSVLRANLRSASYMGGMDYRHEWARRTWSFNGFVAGTHVQGSRAAILATQLYPWRYFQRPDADHLDVDSTATSMTGVSTQNQLAYRHGRHWRFSLSGGTTTPFYETSDLGFQYRSDRIDGQANVTYVEPRPGKFLRSWQTSAWARAERNYDLDHVMDMVGASIYAQHLSYWSTVLEATYNAPSFDDRLTRGGVAADRPAAYGLYGNVFSDSRKRISGGIEAQYNNSTAPSDQTEAGWNGFVALSVNAKPASTIDLTLTPLYWRGTNAAQHLGSRADANATRTFGRRYLFARLDQTELSLQTRLNVTFTPALSLQVYAQPYISSADFGAPSELAAPRTYTFLTYGRDVGTARPVEGGVEVDPDGAGSSPAFVVGDNDFNLRSLRGNAVLRWEWRPGSTLYVAWQQNREDVGAVGSFELGRDRAALFATRPDNVFVVKVNYWLNP